ncbi:MAG TPA: hypothetical protein VG268_02165, partial [Streptosporangiaceae bacterium]|nr:hypothetical protein [Streptosporangiaceae bacterium]
DPPGGIPARGMGQWLAAAPADLIVAMADATRVGQPDGVSMIEIRHVRSDAPAPDGALTRAPGPFLLHAVGAAGTDADRARVDAVLRNVKNSAAPADTGLAAPSFREGQPDAADAHRPGDLRRLTAISQQLDPARVLVFVRGLPGEVG